MSTFGRTFAIEKITGQVLEENPWFKDMLLHWRPAGDALHRDMIDAHKLVSNGQMLEADPKHLRLAISNGYLNLYRSGQSVAKIGFGSGGDLQARIHNKYIHGDKRQRSSPRHPDIGGFLRPGDKQASRVRGPYRPAPLD